MARVDIIIRGTINLDEFECKNITELQEKIEDSEEVSLDITNAGGDVITAYLEFPLVDEI
jgi:hypothetical protein